MKVEKWLSKVSYIGNSNIPDDDGKIYYSIFDGSYITRVGMEDNVKFLAKLEITEELTHGVGFSPKDNKWYGWSHRAIYGFEIGSTCKKGHCHYVASTPEELIDDHAIFFADISDDCAKQKRAECQILDDRSGIRILHTPIKLNVARNADELVEILEGEKSLADAPEVNLFEDSFHTVECGRGEWVAKTMADAKLMAIAFNEGVS
jgi:hypothetical protein